MSEKAEWEAKDELRGIRGWLLLPLAHLVVTMLCLAWISVRLAFTPLGWATLSFFVYAVFCLTRFMHERRETPMLMTAFYAMNIAAAIAMAALRAFGLASNLIPLAIQAAACAAMAAYFHLSLRVKNTFFRGPRG
ncbi:MAG TPA: DUF2569 family protein [Rhizomicrobium sp.]|nr:DUF2569 family protein [Rhizomicrobium sp.]